MIDKYEIIHFEKIISAKIFLNNVRVSPSHWHDNIEILFVLDGEAEVTLNSGKYKLRKEDVFLVNKNHIHKITSDKDNIILVVQIQKEIIEEYFDEEVYFKCNSSIYEYDSKEFNSFNILRKLLSRLFEAYNKNSSGYEILIKGILYEILFILNNNYKIENNNTKINSQKFNDRLKEILLYIQEHYKEDITLIDVASSQYLTPQYFSSFFKKYIGVSFLTYLNTLRLQSAVEDIESTDFSITDIAIKSGFKNIQAFMKIFKETYKVTPSNYRKSIENMKRRSNLEEVFDSIDYIKFTYSSKLEVISKYNNYNTQKSIKALNNLYLNKDYGRINIDKKSKKLNHTWKEVTAIGKLKEVLFAEVQKQLKIAKEDIGFKYVKFHGLLEDELGVYKINDKGEEIYNFSYIDKCIDTLLSMGLKPFGEIGFMPRDLALNPEYTHFYKESILSKPKSLDRWKNLIKVLFNHFIETYGTEEVASWKFEFWNEPDLNFRYWRYSIEEYLEFYHETYKAIKETSTSIKVGGPGTLAGIESKNRFLKVYLQYCKVETCLPDFITFHVYPLDLMVNFQGKNINIPKLSNQKDYLSLSIDEVLKIIKELDLEYLPIQITEFNSSPSHNDLINDTCFKSSYLARNIVRNIDKVQSFTYWTLTDFHEENSMCNKEFHGGLGLFTNKSIKKAGYNAMKILSELGESLIVEDEGYCITQQKNEIQVLIYNYSHYDMSYSLGDISNINYKDRYNVFENTATLNISLILENLKEGKYIITTKSVNRKHGSGYDFVNDNYEEPLLLQDIDYINNMSQPLVTKKTKDIKNEYHIIESLQPNEVKLIKLKKI
ncbi:hypothetical protein GCM10008904_25070 [Paraclostridium ghonii]|uniref:Xylan 1,4-beta-xylosidase n=1 Tax=Paraclostridium ghonii TaxID=29358 RepID=A0ABU0MYZ7_9FIRM|nr:helix-turn-helix domain-containing protein [Paeniclostridium ghonii]MDQ0556142.1 xylan 1,4-beta-xylosidase [Paeniclostridium ghonii]